MMNTDKKEAPASPSGATISHLVPIDSTAVPADHSLSTAHLKMLAEDSAISPEVIAARGYKTLSDPLNARAFNFSQKQTGTGLLIPIRNVHGEVVTYQLRRDDPRFDELLWKSWAD